ncbi:hypothetical protein EMIT0P253_400036 [Pseudomonas sp. IT-P253]
MILKQAKSGQSACGSTTTQSVAAAEGCVRLRSSRKTGMRNMTDTPHYLVLRLLRSRTQPSAAATDLR